MKKIYRFITSLPFMAFLFDACLYHGYRLRLLKVAMELRQPVPLFITLTGLKRFRRCLG